MERFRILYVKKKLALYKFNSLINIKEQKIFNLWEHDFNINRGAHICNNLDFHYIYKGKGISFLLKIKNCCMTVRKGNYLARIKYLEPFSIGRFSSLLQVYSDFVEKLNELTEKMNVPLDFGFIYINVGHLPLEKVTYFKNLLRKNREGNL